LETALNLAVPRLSPAEAPLTLPMPIADSLMTRIMNFFRPAAADPAAPMSDQQRVQLTLAHSIDLRILDAPARADAHRRYLSARNRADAADYIEQVEERIRARRRSAPPRGAP
jgi:hypothetical protein